MSLTAPERRLRRDYVCINSVFGSPEDGVTCIIGSVQWRHHVMLRVTNLIDQDSKKFQVLNLAALHYVLKTNPTHDSPVKFHGLFSVHSFCVPFAKGRATSIQ